MNNSKIYVFKSLNIIIKPVLLESQNTLFINGYSNWGKQRYLIWKDNNLKNGGQLITIIIIFP